MRARTTGVFTLVAAMSALALATPAHAGGGRPAIERHTNTETFADDLILELCGVSTLTTLTERVTITDFPDGSSRLHLTRTYVSEDPRIPVEKGAGSSFTAPDGTRRVVGTPIHLIGSHGTIVIDAGSVTFGPDGQVIAEDGRHPTLEADGLAQYYCADL